MGLPASGKSRFITNFFNDYHIIDPDECDGDTHSEKIEV